MYELTFFNKISFFIIATVQLRIQAYLLLKCNLTLGTLSLNTEDFPLKPPLY